MEIVQTPNACVLATKKNEDLSDANAVRRTIRAQADYDLLSGIRICVRIKRRPFFSNNR